MAFLNNGFFMGGFFVEGQSLYAANDAMTRCEGHKRGVKLEYYCGRILLYFIAKILGRVES